MPVQNLWLEARKQWGQDGTDAIGNYDLEALSCSGCVTARGWELLHKPGSPEISLKMFTVTNVGHMASGGRTVSLTGEDGITIHENLKELADMAEFKLAMRNLKLAAQLVAPWNFSYTVIDGFLQANDYMEKHMEGVKRAPILSAFVDHPVSAGASRSSRAGRAARARRCVWLCSLNEVGGRSRQRPSQSIKRLARAPLFADEDERRAPILLLVRISIRSRRAARIRSI